MDDELEMRQVMFGIVDAFYDASLDFSKKCDMLYALRCQFPSTHGVRALGEDVAYVCGLLEDCSGVPEYVLRCQCSGADRRLATVLVIAYRWEWFSGWFAMGGDKAFDPGSFDDFAGMPASAFVAAGWAYWPF